MDACACASDGVTIDMESIAANFRTESDMGSSWLERLPLADQILLRRAPAGGGLLRRRIDDRAVPMLDQFAVAHAERIEGEHLVPGARSGGGILAVVSVHDGHDIALRRHYLEGIARRRWRARRGSGTHAALPSGGLREKRVA